MKNEKLLLLILATVQFTHIVDFMIIMPLGAQFMEVFEINPRQFSLMVSIYAFSAFVGTLISAGYIDRFDRRTALLGLFVGFAIGTVACAFATDYWLFLAARGLTGLFGGTLGALVLAIVGDAIPLERRASAMGWVMTAFSVASVVGVPAGIFLAAKFSWHMPFFVIGGLAAVFIGLIVLAVPPLRGQLTHRADGERPSPLEAFRQIARSENQRRALYFTLALMLGHFTIIPFIAPYMQLNIGFSNEQVTYIYAIGGTLTAFLLPLFGRLADRVGHVRVFTAASVLSLFSIFAITHLPPVPIALALVTTSSFFVVASGRNVPATTLVTSVVRAENRGSFMSIRQSVNEAALALSSFLAGLIIVERPDGSLGHYAWVGYLAIAMSILAIFLARRLRSIA